MKKMQQEEQELIASNIKKMLNDRGVKTNINLLSVIKNHLPVGTLDIMDDLLNYLGGRANLKDSEDIYKMTPEQVMKVIDAIAK